MARTGRFAFERLEAYHAAHSLHGLCLRVQKSVPKAVKVAGDQAEHYLSEALLSIARSSVEITRRRAITETRLAHHRVEDALHYLRILARRQAGDAPAVTAAIELGERLLVLLSDRLHALRRR
jgi:hypothetical protein